MGHILHHQDLRFGAEGEEQPEQDVPHAGEQPL
jgi:hypothetical protein